MEILKFGEFKNENYSENKEGKIISKNIDKIGQKVFDENSQLFLDYFSANIKRNKFTRKLRDLLERNYGHLLLNSEIEEIINNFIEYQSPNWHSLPYPPPRGTELS